MERLPTGSTWESGERQVGQRQVGIVHGYDERRQEES